MENSDSHPLLWQEPKEPGTGCFQGGETLGLRDIRPEKEESLRFDSMVFDNSFRLGPRRRSFSCDDDDMMIMSSNSLQNMFPLSRIDSVKLPSETVTNSDRSLKHQSSSIDSCLLSKYEPTSPSTDDVFKTRMKDFSNKNDSLRRLFRQRSSSCPYETHLDLLMQPTSQARYRRSAKMNRSFSRRIPYEQSDSYSSTLISRDSYASLDSLPDENPTQEVLHLPSHIADNVTEESIAAWANKNKYMIGNPPVYYPTQKPREHRESEVRRVNALHTRMQIEAKEKNRSFFSCLPRLIK